MQVKRGNQKSRKSKNLVEYEIKTYGSNVGRNKSPTNSNKPTTKRSPVKRESVEAEATGEMAFINPNEINNPNQKYSIRSPVRFPESKNNSKKTRETGERENISKKNEFSEYKIPEKALNLDTRKEKLRRSPKTINLGETPQEVENNIKSINRPKKSIKDGLKEKDKDGSVIERTYNMITNEAGNIFLDQPIHQKSFMNQQDVIDARGSFDSKDMKDMQYSINPRDFNEPLSGIFGKMSPKGNIEVDSDTNSEKNENIDTSNNAQIKDLRKQLEKRKNLKIRNDDGVKEGGKPIKNELEKIEDLVKRQESKGKETNITEEEVKKLVKLYLQGNDPKKEGEGRLISNKQTVLPSIKEDLFTDRYKVLQKMNKLSNILLSKRKSLNNYEISTLNRSFGERSFDKTTLNNTTLGGKKGTLRGKQHKFLFISLAMLSAKGDERTILRRMRLEKGGVVS